MLVRTALNEIQRGLREAPAVLLVGPRQCGKTTLARSLGSAYADLEQPGEQVRVDATWESLLRESAPLILDEAQAWPEVFTRLRGAIDADRQRMGRFLLLGSVAPSLMTRVAESLTGRMRVVELGPLLLGEVGVDRLDDLWLLGGYPDGGILGHAGFPRWQRDYLQLLAARDLPQWGLTAKPQQCDRLMTMLAAVHSEQWNASRIGASLGMSYHTVDHQVDVLEGAGLLRRLRPWAANLGKRLAKRPKIYWRDSGLLHSLLGAGRLDAVLRQPWAGASWEGFVIEQVLGTLTAHGMRPEAGFLRVDNRLEADLVVAMPDGPWLIEIKLTSQVDSGDLAAVRRVADLLRPARRILVSRMPQVIEGEGGLLLCPLPELLQRVTAALA